MYDAVYEGNEGDEIACLIPLQSFDDADELTPDPEPRPKRSAFKVHFPNVPVPRLGPHIAYRWCEIDPAEL